MEGKLPVARLATQPFKVVSPYEPAGDQPKAIERLARNIESGMRYETLLGVTGSGKTYTMAKTIEAVQKPTLVLARIPLSKRMPPLMRKWKNCVMQQPPNFFPVVM